MSQVVYLFSALLVAAVELVVDRRLLVYLLLQLTIGSGLAEVMVEILVYWLSRTSMNSQHMKFQTMGLLGRIIANSATHQK